MFSPLNTWIFVQHSVRGRRGWKSHELQKAPAHDLSRRNKIFALENNHQQLVTEQKAAKINSFKGSSDTHGVQTPKWLHETNQTPSCKAGTKNTQLP